MRILFKNFGQESHRSFSGAKQDNLPPKCVEESTGKVMAQNLLGGFSNFHIQDFAHTDISLLTLQPSCQHDLRQLK